MSRKILCEACGSILNEDILKQKNSLNTCLVCGASLGMDESELESAPEEELVDWYYYLVGKKEHKVKNHILTKELIDDDEMLTLEYKFVAPNNSDKAKEILRKEYDSDALTTYVNTNPEPTVKCPRCGSTNIQLVQRKFSIWTGFRTNRVDRVCINCMHRW